MQHQVIRRLASVTARWGGTSVGTDFHRVSPYTYSLGSLAGPLGRIKSIDVRYDIASKTEFVVLTGDSGTTETFDMEYVDAEVGVPGDEFKTVEDVVPQ